MEYASAILLMSLLSVSLTVYDLRKVSTLPPMMGNDSFLPAAALELRPQNVTSSWTRDQVIAT